MTTTPAVTTQQRNPGRATWRTVVQGVLSAVLVLGVVLPIVAGILDEEVGHLLGEHAVAVIAAVSAGVAAVAGALSRIMAIPAVDGWLERLGLSSAPGVDSTQRLIRHGQDARILPVDPPDEPER